MPVVTGDKTTSVSTPEASPCVLAAWTSGKWLPLEADEADEAEAALAADRKRKVSQALAAVVSADQSMTLFGLGPSAGVGGPSMSDLWRAVRDHDPKLFEEMKTQVGDSTSDGEVGDIEELLSRCQLAASSPITPAPKVKTFIESAEKIIADMCRKFVSTSDLEDHAHLVRLLARRPPDKSRARVFTTNYDLCIEQAAAQSGVLLIDGFGREMPPVFDGTNFDLDFVRRRPEARAPEYLAGVLHLVKIHGSVDWAAENGQIVRRESPAAPIIIYPRRDKFELSYRQPFLETISQLQMCLRQPNLGVLVAGFGFSDAHLSEMLFSAVRKNLSLKLVVATRGCEYHCDPLQKTYRPALERLARLASRGDSRITLIDCDFGTLTRLVPDVGTETEEDRIKTLIRSLTS